MFDGSIEYIFVGQKLHKNCAVLNQATEPDHYY